MFRLPSFKGWRIRKNENEIEDCFMKRINFAIEQKMEIHQYMMQIGNNECEM